MSKPNFFAGIDALNCLLQTDFAKPTKDVDLTLDLIELPFWFSFKSDEKTKTLKAYTQMDLYSKDESMATEKGSVVLDRASGRASIKAVQEIGENMGVFYAACQKLSCLIQEKGLEPLYADLDPDEAGILLMENNGELSWKVVSGRERPSLTVQTLFGGTTMGRPYMDDFLERSELDDLNLEEKIEAAEEGNITAMEELAMLYLNGDEDQEIDPDPEKCVYWFRKVAEAGDATAMFNLGLHYAKGHGVVRDFAKAAEWMKKAADNGDEDAPTSYEMYSKASENLKKAEAGDAAAQAEMAKLFTQIGGSLDQFGSGNDYQEAFKWAKKSADQGNLEGMYCLALCYEHGRGTRMSPSKAVSTYEKAAKQGHAPSQWNLAVCYLNGNGVQRDETKGYSWAYQAADQGNELAINVLEAQGMTIKQIIKRYSDPEYHVTLEGTQYEGRADRCERIRAGMELRYKIIKDKNGEDALECFYNGGSVGLISRRAVGDVIALLRLERAALKIKVKSCIPKSKRGARARNADVHLTLKLTERKPETPEERAARLKAEEEARRKAEEERKRKKEERRKAEEARRKAEAEAKAKREEELRRYNEAHKKWESECADINIKRTASVDAQIAEEKAAIVNAATKKRDEVIAKANAVVKEQTERKALAESTLASLGMFKFGEKKAQKSIIEEATKLLTEAQASISSAESVYSTEIGEADKKAESKRLSFQKNAEIEFPLPVEPKKPN